MFQFIFGIFSLITIYCITLFVLLFFQHLPQSVFDKLIINLGNEIGLIKKYITKMYHKSLYIGHTSFPNFAYKCGATAYAQSASFVRKNKNPQS